MGSVAVLRDRDVLAEIAAYEETPYSSRLFRDVDEVQRKAKIALDQVDVFAVASGPGSFTGLRVGLTAVKDWAEVYRKPIAAISGLHAIAWEAQTSDTPMTPKSATGMRLIAPFLDARRGQIFGAIYKESADEKLSLALEGDESILSPDEFLETLKQRSSSPPDFVSSTPEALSADRIHTIFPGARVISVAAALAPTIGRLGYEMALRGELADPLRVDANYVRRSDAEAAWKDG
jgi:tRNA threonylcarbamoyladenosine biosynthesis protein TsaB